MIDLKPIEDEVRILETELVKKKNELSKAKDSNLKEQYGENFGCHNCAYGCCVAVYDYHTSCTKGNCIHCRSYCVNYMPENELSAYIRDKHYYDENMLDTLNDLFDVLDIMNKPELHEQALEILRLRDNKED